MLLWRGLRFETECRQCIERWSGVTGVMLHVFSAKLLPRSRLFFECNVSAKVWEFIAKGAKGFLRHSYTTVWSVIMFIISDKTREKKSLLCIKYAFQAVLRERNKIKHREKMMPLMVLNKVIEKGIRNRISLVRKKGTKGMEELLQFWSKTRM